MTTLSTFQSMRPVGNHEFETVDSETVYSGNILALRTDEVSMPSGGTARREVVEHFGAVAVVAVNDARQVAMVYQYRHPVGRRLWELPAGLLDVGGEDPAVTAARELQEEVGLAARDWAVLADIVTSPGFSDEAVRIYLARDLSHVGRPAAEHEEADMTVHWVDLAEAAAQVLAGDIVNSIAVTGIMSAYAVIADGKNPRTVDAAWPTRPAAFAARKVSQ
jgi:ADP-ribose pyrophosphatase